MASNEHDDAELISRLRDELAIAEREVEDLALERDRLRDDLLVWIEACNEHALDRNPAALILWHRKDALSISYTSLERDTHRLVQLIAEHLGAIPERRPDGGPA